MENPNVGNAVSRIAILLEYPTVNGGENSMLAVLKHLLDGGASNSGFEFCVLGPTEGAMAQRVAQLGIPSYELNLTADDGLRLPRDKAIPRLIEAAGKSGAHLLHGNSLAMGRLLGAASRQHSGIVATAHLRDIMKLSRAAISDLNANRQLIAVSEATLKFHVIQGLDERVGSVIHNGIDVDDFVADNSTGMQIRQELGISDDAIVLLTVGQIGLRKGLDTLAEAGRMLAGRTKGIHWLLAGERFSQKAESVAYEANVLSVLESCRPELVLHQLGYRRDVPALMQAADILVHAARQEPLGRVLLEAAASGLAIVATNVGGTGEILTHRKSALLVPVDSPEAIADAVDDLIGNVDLRMRLAVAAREKVRAEFGIARSAESLVNVWKSVLREAEKTPGAP